MAIQGVGGDHTVTAQSDGAGLQFGTDFASKLKQSADRISDFADKSGSEFQNDSSLYQEASRLDKLLHQGVQSYATGNAKGLNDDSKDYLTNLSRLMGQPMAGARGEGGSTTQLDYVADSLRSVLTPVVDTKSAGGAGSASDPVTTGTGGNMDAANVMLDRIKTAETSDAKADDILDLIAILQNSLGGAVASKSDAAVIPETGPAKPVTKLADQVKADPETDGQMSQPAPQAPAAPEQRLVGDQLMTMMEAPEGAGLTLEDGKGGDMGIGVKTKGAPKDNGHDEIGGDEVLKFHAPEGTQSAQVDIVDLFGDKGGKPQEKGIITVKDGDGNVLDTIEIRGNKSGDQTVKIDQPFATLEFSTPEGRSDFAPSGITLNPTGNTSGGDAAVPAGNMSELLSAMTEITNFINSSTALSEASKQKLMGNVTQVLEQIVMSKDSAGDGGDAVTSTEGLGLLASLKTLTTDLKSAGDDTSKKQQGLDALATGIASLNSLSKPTDIQTA
ncbi:hypothetical protein [Parasulfitobacter algicola]|uniref:Uncharacterized protein n=1 Tax=Parasulfitobacter algicola TaxID=2614809 RepID=A0ABX2J1H8_9RHOB|nr:hypothetical protein [Sulfitobacter algicola]NSX56768.1 hypothetical protein [Sulfitobacter algicola]